jgi:hypothetical protein
MVPVSKRRKSKEKVTHTSSNAKRACYHVNASRNESLLLRPFRAGNESRNASKRST